MANIYVRNAGSGTSPYDTWAKAATTLTAALAIATNADTVWVANDHAESTVGAVTLTCPSTPGLRILGANTNVTEPPTGLVSTPSATIAVGASSNILSIFNFAYVYGLHFQGGTTTSANCSISIGYTNVPQGLVIENCKLEMRGTSAATYIRLGTLAGTTIDDGSVQLINCNAKFNLSASQMLICGGIVKLRSLTLDATSGATPTTLFGSIASANGAALVEASDLSGLGWTNLVDGSGASYTPFVFRDCKLPSGVTIATGSIAGPGGTSIQLHNCDSADTNYRIARHTYAGSVVSETTIVRTGGASDGTTGLSWRMATAAAAQYPSIPLESPEIVQWNATTGSAVTATVEIVHDSQGAGSGSKFQDDEIWLEVMYLGTTGFPLGTWITDCKADVLATAANQTDSTETWTTTGLTTPVKQKLSVTFTPQEKGFVHARVVMAKASKTAYICPKMTVA